MSILEQIRKLDEQKSALLSQAKQEALTAAHTAIKALNELGFNYTLAQGDATTTTTTGTRRTGIREDVLAVVKNAGSKGTTPAAIRTALNLSGKSASQSVANALSALKKDNKITKDGDAYKAS